MIEFENVSFAYTGQEHDGLRDINLKISDGECVLFCGRSGCGKTTITRLVNGLIPQFYQGELQGRVLVDGQEISSLPMYQIAAKVGSVFQNPRTQFFNVDTDSEIAFGIENEARPPQELIERVEQTADDLRIQKLRNRNIFELSGGEKQKIAFASVYAMNPQIYLLDEPSSNLDMTSIQELGEHLRLIKKQGKTVLIAEHRLYYLMELADRIVYLEKGEIKGIYTIRIDSYGEIIKVETLRGCGIQEWDNQVLQIIKGMPRWTPTINFHGKGEYRHSVWTVPVLFKNDSPTKNEVNNYNWLIKTLSKSCKYPPKLQKKNREGMVYVTYKLDGNGYITNPQVISCNNRKFKRAALNAFNAVTGISITLPAPKDTLVFQFKLDRPTTPINPHTDVLIIGYSSCDTPILMRYDATLTAHTTEPYLEVGVPVCYLNERGDTIVPYGKYRYCQTDTIKKIGFAYENKPKDARIICINDAGKELFYVFKYDNGPDYIQEGLFRIMNEDGLVGFADSLGNVIIEPQFKFAYPFKGGKTKATLKGERKVVPESDGEKHYWESETWFYIDKKNRRLTD